MKEFESWNKLRGIDFRIRFSPPKQFEAYIEQEREDSYTAALEWVQNKINEINEGGSIIEYIKEELHAKT